MRHLCLIIRRRRGWKHASSAPESAHEQRGESPLQANALRPETESNCSVRRRGGEQLEVNDQSVAIANSIRPDVTASQLDNGEAQTLPQSKEVRDAEG